MKITVDLRLYSRSINSNEISTLTEIISAWPVSISSTPSFLITDMKDEEIKNNPTWVADSKRLILQHSQGMKRKLAIIWSHQSQKKKCEGRMTAERRKSFDTIPD